MTVSLLFKKGYIGSLTLDHRILMGAMHLGIEGDREQLNQLKAFYSERAKGGAALIITGGAAVLPSGGGDHMYCLTEQDHRVQLQELIEAVHLARGKMALQLQHNGRYAKSSETGLEPVAPSAIMSKVTKERPVALSTKEIHDIRDAFVNGAVFAESAGFDAVELMGSEGYLLNQFLSPLTNQREDKYGGDFYKRMALPLEIVSGIRKSLGSDYPVIYRMSGDDYMDGSTTRAETVQFARELAKHGVDALNVGVGWHESRVPTVAAIVRAGAFAHVASEIRQAVNIPVIGANRIHTPECADDVLNQQLMDFVAPARPWLADASFAQKAKTGGREELNVCISCNQECLDHTMGHPPSPVGCLVNPRTGHEWKWGLKDRDHHGQQRQNIAVVGGGIAGLAAAKALAEKCERVTLFEAKGQLGGQFLLASQIPGKENFLETIRFYKTSLERLNVNVKLSYQPAIDELRAFDKVIIATGVEPNIPRLLKGTDLPHVAAYSDILSKTVTLGKRIAIVGGGGIGCDLAHFIAESQAEQSHRVDVTVISRSPKPAKRVGPTTRWVLISKLRQLGVNILKGFECKEITEDGVWVQNNDGQQFIEADQVILCTGQTENRELFDALKGHVPIETIGGSDIASELNAAKAIQQAYSLIYDSITEEASAKN
ncbi:2,4-dienoyl-CoA reductase (NADPH2) [Scopulibacillus darangshiensis]|uniref:2,4-dienoyl-CoA reductase (NADPH2) n=1 Tax=Scopulibacillus darangshiensis TaxID=442528 RepID=A0A4R2P4R4_9BACL|nr:FAD-dependent oxidoreductase [Scopulibacillus darangshiensis]TCP28755.1 2,4-dienoyl-CoA reductase (NADPH2) [Scopulibacillus darangshiensis]